MPHYLIAAGQFDVVQDGVCCGGTARGGSRGDRAAHAVPNSQRCRPYRRHGVKLAREPFLTAVLGHAATERQARTIASDLLTADPARDDDPRPRTRRSGMKRAARDRPDRTSGGRHGRGGPPLDGRHSWLGIALAEQVCADPPGARRRQTTCHTELRPRRPQVRVLLPMRVTESTRPAASGKNRMMSQRQVSGRTWMMIEQHEHQADHGGDRARRVPDDRAEAEGDQRDHCDEQRGADDCGEHGRRRRSRWCRRTCSSAGPFGPLWAGLMLTPAGIVTEWNSDAATPEPDSVA